MGPLFAIIAMAMFGATVGFFVGLLVSYAGVPLYYSARRKPKEERWIRGIRKAYLTLIIAAVFGAVAGAGPLAMTVYEIIYADDYWKSTGLGDWCRMPLVYPYEMCTISGHKDADIRVWKTKEDVVRRVTMYYRDGPVIVGEHDVWVKEPYSDYLIDTTFADGNVMSIDSTWNWFPGEDATNWFTLDCETGQVHEFETHEEYLEGLKALGFEEEPELRTIWQNWE